MRSRTVLQLVTMALLALPALWLALQIARELSVPGTALGADPGEAVTEYLGVWSIRVLLLALCVSPLRRLTGMSALAPLRRTVGLFAFGYVLAHLLSYLALIAVFDLGLILEDLTRRRYIVAGAFALLLLVPLAVTSTRAWQRRLGRRWLQLHRLVFGAALAALLHLFWLTRDGYGEPLLYAALLTLVLAERLFNSLQRRRPAPTAPAP